jgi:hypothetical protein
MRAIILIWCALGIVGMGVSANAVAQLPLAGIGTVLKTVLTLVLCSGALFGIWAALRERWPAIRDWQWPFNPFFSGGLLLIITSFLIFVGITASVVAIARHPTAGVPFQLGGLFTLSAAISLGAWALHHDLEVGRGLLKFVAIAAAIGSLALLVLVIVKPVSSVIWYVAAIALLLLPLCIATLWQLRSRRPGRHEHVAGESGKTV